MLFISNLNFIVGCILVGLIWTIQVVHYPLFLRVSKESFVDYMKAHQKKVSLLVIPLMSFELFSSAYLFFFNNKSDLNIFYHLSFYIVIVIWLLTFFIHMPQHKKLLLGFNQIVIKELVFTNWIRTILWSLKLIVMFKAQSLI